MVGEWFIGAREVDAIGISAGAIGHDTDEGIGGFRSKLASECFGDNTEVIGRDCRSPSVMCREGCEECERGTFRGFDEEDRNRSVDIGSLSDFEWVIVAGVHGDGIGIAAAELDPACVSWLHEPTTAVDKLVSVCGRISGLCGDSFLIGRDDGLSDPVREFMGVFGLGWGTVCPHGGGCGVGVCCADEYMVGAKRSLIGDYFFGLVDDMGGYTEAIDDADSDWLVGWEIENQSSGEERVNDAVCLDSGDVPADPDG
jgi:hypothetical protein